ncbi:MAG: M20/M25/M40 family metallo-hydrolase [Chitinophagales bacterium]|nr:M20/M25/M40 family metallo-hydrolase [Chitinophagales bacterium]MDW8427046.1 M20/M25/M40 family metallo-hydrolase [Chitinophagales bacterium]
MKQWFLVALATVSFSLKASNPDDSLLRSRLQQHVAFLASDKLQGRLTGSKGEKRAYKYLIKEFRKWSLDPSGKSYLQPFTYQAGKELKGKNSCILNGVPLQFEKDYFPLVLSANGRARGPIVDVGYGLVISSLNYDSYKGLTDLKGKIFLMEISTPEGDNPHSPFAPHADLLQRVKLAHARGALAVLFTNTHPDVEDPRPDFHRNVADAPIPVAFIRGERWKQLRRSQINIIDLNVNLKRITVTGHNVLAYLSNQAPYTVVVGAHYDHLGYNERGGSTYQGPPAIHNGADDNASGTAALLELARLLATNGLREQNNFLFIAFSGEEEGLIGSKYFVQNSTISKESINYMINMDMIGRYRREKGLQISGLGTSPAAFAFLDTLKWDSIVVRTSRAGTGPTDHTSFYHAGIPVLSFFTGTHPDYHKPSDDAHLLNYGAHASIVKLIYHIIQQLDAAGKLPFEKTPEADQAAAPAFRVRLGVTPDYAFEGPGMRIEGVNEGQPAARAGLQKGDVLVQLGDFPITDVVSYMKALAAFNKGERVPARILRNGEQLTVTITF